MKSQWKRIFRLVETILFKFAKYLFHRKQFFHLVEIYFKRILYYSQQQRIFCLVETIFFHSDFFGNHYRNQKKSNIFKKILFLLLWRKLSSSIFFQILTPMEVAFQFSEIAFFNFSRNLSFWLVEIDFRLITNFVLLFGAFFCWRTQCLELGVNQFSSIFSIPNSASSFSGQWKRIFYRMLYSGEWKRIFCLAFFYLNQMLCQWKSLFMLS